MFTLLYYEKYGPEHQEEHLWVYYLTIGMLIYLDGHSSTDLAYDVHSDARYIHNPKDNLAETNNKNCKYLNVNQYQGLMLKPTKHYFLTYYVNAYFSGLYGYEYIEYTISGK